MDRNNTHRARSDLRFDQRRVDRERVGVRVAEHYSAASLSDGFGGRDPRMGGGDHLSAGLQPEGAHRDVKRVGSIGARDTMFHTQRFRPGLFECVNLRTPDVSRLGNHVGDSRIDLSLQREILRVQVNEWDFHDLLMAHGII
jgi:hypothetical protein